MDEKIIELDDVTMRFMIQKRRYGFKNIVLHLAQYIRDRREAVQFTALDRVDLKICRGERVGIIGPNGSGKTTLLSVIGGVYKRYEGAVKVRGRVSMMLALGAGFCPELSGRENIYLNGILQGKTRREMEGGVEDIIEFADIGPFIDAPVYTYSSGMQARLSFGVATAIEPEILLVDEVLAVGDADFAAKCETRIGGLLKKGVTLVLVSHSMGDIRKYCSRVIRLEHGRVVADGTVDEVLGGVA
jgi:ABC-2 type transport system ATP-binding protein